MFKIFCCTSMCVPSFSCGHVTLKSEVAQASVEAAFILPIALLLCGMMVQVGIYGFTRSVMMRTCAETVRVASFDFDGNTQDCCEFAKRRLKAIPNLTLFHTPSPDDWDIQIQISDRSAKVSITGHFQPIPVIGALVEAFTEKDDKGCIIRAEVEEHTQPSWVEGSYDGWQKIWG